MALEPVINKPTGAKPITVNGVTFRCYSIGILRYEWRSDDGRCAVRRRYPSTETYIARADDKWMLTRFRSQKNAMMAAVKTAAKSEN